jgi:hypothetical protein
MISEFPCKTDFRLGCIRPAQWRSGEHCGFRAVPVHSAHFLAQQEVDGGGCHSNLAFSFTVEVFEKGLPGSVPFLRVELCKADDDVGAEINASSMCRTRLVVRKRRPPKHSIFRWHGVWMLAVLQAEYGMLRTGHHSISRDICMLPTLQNLTNR